jgi:hypothetical protein
MTSAKESDLLQKVKSVVPKLTSGMHKVRVHIHYPKHSLTRDKESDLLQKVKSVVPKLISGMHKVRNHLQAFSDRC